VSGPTAFIVNSLGSGATPPGSVTSCTIDQSFSPAKLVACAVTSTGTLDSPSTVAFAGPYAFVPQRAGALGVAYCGVAGTALTCAAGLSLNQAPEDIAIVGAYAFIIRRGNKRVQMCDVVGGTLSGCVQGDAIVAASAPRGILVLGDTMLIASTGNALIVKCPLNWANWAAARATVYTSAGCADSGVTGLSSPVTMLAV
jgi:hypothetical protein